MLFVCRLLCVLSSLRMHPSMPCRSWLGQAPALWWTTPRRREARRSQHAAAAERSQRAASVPSVLTCCSRQHRQHSRQHRQHSRHQVSQAQTQGKTQLAAALAQGDSHPPIVDVGMGDSRAAVAASWGRAASVAAVHSLCVADVVAVACMAVSCERSCWACHVESGAGL